MHTVRPKRSPAWSLANRGGAGATRLVAGATALLLGCVAAWSQGWPVPEAAGRVRVDRVKKTAWPAGVGFAEVWPAGTDPTRCHVAAFTTAGRPVGAQVLWAALGEPLKILFDTSSGEVTYDVYLREGAVAGPAWQPEAGVVLETRVRKDGPLDTWDKAWRLYTTSDPVLGRSVLPQIFLGVHPHGPTTNFSGHYRAWFTAKKPGSYEFAVVSTGTAYLRIDEKVVAKRMGVSGSRGRRGEYNGRIDLTAGRHQMDYLFFQAGAGEWVAEVGWKPPEGTNYCQLMPAEAFVAAARFNSFSWTPPPGRTDKAAFEWEPVGHNLVDGQALVSMRFQAVGGRKETGCRWKFDDGGVATGSPVVHVFPQTGLRRVEFTTDERAGPAAALADRVRVRPNWLQLEEWREPLYQEQKKQLLATDVGTMPVEDLVALVKLADALAQPDLLLRAGRACLDRTNEFKSFQAEVFYTLGNHLESSQARDYAGSEKALRTALALAAEDTSLKDRARIGLARLSTDAFNRPAEALDLLKNVRPDLLVSRDIRDAGLARGDALAALGRIEEATQAYRSAGELAGLAELPHSVRSAARLESARDLIRREEWDAAETILRQIEWETPLARLSAETGLPMILVHQGRQEHPLAVSRCQRLLHSATVDTHRADVLYHLAESELTLGGEGVARETVRKLVKEHPYSEAAARAKDRWPDLAGTGKK